MSRVTVAVRRISPLLLGALVFVPSVYGEKFAAAYRQAIMTIEQHIEASDLDGARALIVSSYKEYPKDGGLDNLLGVVEVRQGHVDRAKRAFADAIHHSPKSIGAYLNLGRIDLQTSGSDLTLRREALELYEKVLLIDPDNAEANYQAATLFMRANNYRRSLELVAKLDSDARNQIGAEALVCADNAGLGQIEATDRAAAAMVVNPELTEQDAMFVFPALRAAHRADLLDEIFSVVNTRQPLSVSGLRILGLAQEAEGKLEQARTTLERVFAADNTEMSSLVDLARVALASKDYQGALGYLAHARDLQPRNASLPYEFGVICLKLDLFGEARKGMEEAVSLDPDNPEYNMGMGIVSSWAQDASSALPYLKKYHEQRPSDVAGILALGMTYFRTKDFDNASMWLNQAARAKGTAPAAEYYLGRIARQQGRLDEAIGHLSQSLTLERDQPEVVAELGGISVQMRKYKAAEKQLKLAISLDPDSYAANFALLQLYARTGDSRREIQSERFEAIKNKNEEQSREAMRVIEIRSQTDPLIVPVK